MVRLSRRRALCLAGSGLIATAKLARAASADVSGSLPDLDFHMQRADTGALASAAEFRGFVVLLNFGYTYCPDICPTTLANLSAALDRLGPLKRSVRVLFVTVDPARDTLEALRHLTAPFGPDVIGMRPSPNMLDTLARRYRVAYSVQPARDDAPYAVSHATGVYVFDRARKARAILTGLDQPSPDLDGVAETIRRAAQPQRGLLARLLGG
jgi:protein SCO1/2